jgi:hypothetical protein
MAVLNRMMLHGGFDEAVEERVRVVGLAEELGVELAGDEEGVRGQLDHLGKAAFREVPEMSMPFFPSALCSRN